MKHEILSVGEKVQYKVFAEIKNGVIELTATNLYVVEGEEVEPTPTKDILLTSGALDRLVALAKKERIDKK